MVETDTIPAELFVTIPVAVAVQPLLSVTVTLYAPPDKPVRDESFSPTVKLLHANVYGLEPPFTRAVIAPTALTQFVLFVVTIEIETPAG